MAKMASEDAMLTEIPEEYTNGVRDGISKVTQFLRQLAHDFTLIEGPDSHEAAYHNHLADVIDEDNK